MKKEKSDLMNPMEEVPAHAASGKRYPAEWTETFSAAKVTLFSKKAKNLILFKYKGLFFVDFFLF